MFDGGEVGRVGWQEEELTASGLDQGTHGLGAMEANVVEHHDLPGSQRRAEQVTDVDGEGGGVRGAVEGQSRSQARGRERGQQCGRGAVVAGDVTPGALAAWRAGVASG